MGVTPEHSSFIESCTRLSVSLEGPGVYAIASSSSCNETGNGSTSNNNKCNTKPKNSSNSSGGSSSATTSAKRRHNKIYHHSHSHSNKEEEAEEEDDENEIEGGIYRNRGHRNSFTISTSAVVHPRQQLGIRHSSSCSSTRSSKSASAGGSSNHMTMDELRAVNRYAESTKSLSYLPQVSG